MPAVWPAGSATGHVFAQFGAAKDADSDGTQEPGEVTGTVTYTPADARISPNRGVGVTVHPFTAPVVSSMSAADLYAHEEGTLWFATIKLDGVAPETVEFVVTPGSQTDLVGRIGAARPVDPLTPPDGTPAALAALDVRVTANAAAIETLAVVGYDDTAIYAALQAHIAALTPHPAYDTDIPSLSLIYENGLI